MCVCVCVGGGWGEARCGVCGEGVGGGGKRDSKGERFL